MQTTSPASQNASASPANARRPGWFRRNWLRAIISLMLLFVLAAVGGYLYKFGPILFSTPYHMAMAELQQEPDVKKMLGDPIHDSWFPAGNVNNEEGEARFYFRVHGPGTDGHESKADVSVQARCVGDKWDFTQFDIQPEGGQRLNLIDAIQARGTPDTPLFDSKSAPAPTKTEATPPQDVNIQIPDMPADGEKSGDKK